MSTGFLYLLLYAGITSVFTLVTKKITNFKVVIPDEQALEQEKALSAEKASKLRNVWFNIFRKLDIRLAMSYMTDLFINETALKIKALNRLGLRKEISFVASKNSRDETNNTIIVTNFGKYSLTDDYDKGYYKEQIIDNTTQRVLYEKDYPKASFGMQLIRNPDANRVKEFYCEGCGTPIQLDGEVFICKNCGAKYSADNFEWMLSHVNASDNKVIQTKTSTQKYATYGKLAGYFTLAMVPLSFFSGKLYILKLLTYLAIIVCILMYPIAIATTLMMHIPYRKLVSFDPLATPQKVADRTGYLLGLMYGCYQTEPYKMKPFMEEDCYTQWRKEAEVLKQLQPNNSQVFDWDSYMQSFNIKKFWVDSKMQYITLWTTVSYLFLTEDRQVKEASTLHQVTLCKNINSKYKHSLSVESHFCSGCGMPIDFTAEGKCKFCGNTYDIAEFDWKIHSFSEPFGTMLNLGRKVINILGIKEESMKATKKALEKQVELYSDKTPLPPQMSEEQLKIRKKAYEIYMAEQKGLR